MVNGQPFDSLAPCAVSTRWEHEHVVVERSGGELSIERRDGTVQVSHGLHANDLREALVPHVTAAVSACGCGRDEFEAIMVGLVRTTVSSPVDAWATYYRNSLGDLLSGASDFAPIHERAEQLCVGSVLDLGSCFGFFPLRLALSGRDVVATDVHAGTVRLLDSMRIPLGVELETLVCDARRVPVHDNHVDTVTALHLFEHLDEVAGEQVLREAMRIARRRVIVAVPFEREAEACHGHVRTFDMVSLAELGDATGLRHDTVEFHGGWLTIDL
jgi:hypothetical protein